MTNFKERTNTLLYNNIPLTLYSKGLMLVVCEMGVGDGDRLLHIDPTVLLNIAALLSHSGWAAQPWVLEVPSPQSGAGSYSAGILSSTATATQTPQAVCGTSLHNCLTSTCFLWAYTSAPNSTTSTSQGDIPISSTACTCLAFFCLFTQVHLLIDG